MTAVAIQALNSSDSLIEVTRLKILQQNQPGPPYFYDYYSSGTTTMFYFLMRGSLTPNLNSPQSYINPQIVDWPLDENGDYINSAVNALLNHNIDHIIDQLQPEDSTRIFFGCGSADESLYLGHIAFMSTLDSLGLPYEFYDHNGGYIMPTGFKERALIFIDSILMNPHTNTGLNGISAQDEFHCLIYPNPTSKFVNISLYSKKSENVVLSVRDINGKEKKHIPIGKISNIIHEIDCTDLSPGIYFVTVKTNLRVQTMKLIIE